MRNNGTAMAVLAAPLPAALVCQRMQQNRASLVEAIRAKDPRRMLERDIGKLEQFFPGYTVPGSKEVQRLDLLLLTIATTLE